MFYYIEKNGTFQTMEEKPAVDNGYYFSDSISDLYRERVELSGEQWNFHRLHPAASPAEVWKMELKPQPVLSPADMRRVAYQTHRIIAWDGDMVTVDEANKLFLDYSAEGKEDVTAQLQELIKAAKEKIREEIAD